MTNPEDTAHKISHILSSRRQFIRSALAVSGMAAIPRGLLAAEAGPSPYGSIADRDGSGVLLPTGFSARVIAVSGQNVPGTSFRWRGAPDGAATFDDGNGGWYHAVNHELSNGGVSVIHYNSAANIVDAYSVLDGTSRNCAGGPTPWGTWLSCEEVSDGQVYECDPTQPSQGTVRPALGRFNHEAVAVDPIRQQLFLTEDRSDGLFYRFRPDNYPSLGSGVLEAARLSGGQVSWVEIPDPNATSQSTRYQRPSSQITRFNGGEGIWYQDDKVWFTTKGDNSVWEFDLINNTLVRIWDGGTPLTGVDNITVEKGSGDIFVAEDGGNMELVIISAEGNVAPFLRVTGQGGSEITGPVFNPTGNRMYFSSQRGTNGNGITYEITGPFRGIAGTPPPSPPPLTGLLGSFLFQNVDTGTYMTESSTNFIELTSSTNSRAIWDLVDIGNGRVHLINQETGRWLDSDGSGAVIGTSSSPASDDEWDLSELSEGTYTLRNISANRFADSDSDDRIRLRNDQNRDAQWRLLPTQSLPLGTYVLQNVQAGTFLSETSSNFTELTNGTSPDSVWEVVDIGDGLSHLINQDTGRWLDSDGPGTVVGTSSSPRSDDRWELEPFGAGIYTIRNVSANRFVDADSDNRVRLRSDQNTDARWRFLWVRS